MDLTNTKRIPAKDLVEGMVVLNIETRTTRTCTTNARPTHRGYIMAHTNLSGYPVNLRGTDLVTIVVAK
jgi:hypothetical protein